MRKGLAMKQNDLLTQLRGLVDELNDKVARAEAAGTNNKPPKAEALAEAVRALSAMRSLKMSW
jgi:hypothetical protein